ncbi:hypothetical protein Tco_0974185 [Tanacetum coccineum]|uniref:Uncharacterized protein n=1 Tax=Tanacetum coccineum TaxID=301880 RepID=A0ABQ5EAY7_9ASTR
MRLSMTNPYSYNETPTSFPTSQYQYESYGVTLWRELQWGLRLSNRDGNSFDYNPNPNSFNESQNFSDYPPQPQYETNICELCGNDAHYDYDCSPQVPFVYNQNPCFDQNFDNNFPPTSPSFPQQYLCCENCGGPHATFQCQPMNQNLSNSNSSGFDQFQPPQYPVIHHSPQETSEEVLQAREDLMKAIQTFLRKFSRIPFGEIPKVLLIAWERFSEIKHAFTDKQYQQEDIQELMSKLLEDVRNINEELSEFINSPSWNHPTFYNDDDEYTVIYRKPKAIAPDLPIEEPDNSLSMGTSILTLFWKQKSLLLRTFRDMSITSPKIDFLPEEFAEELDFIDPILPRTDEDNFDEEDFDEEEGEIDNDILQIEDEILREKLLNVNLLVDKIEALKLTPFIPFVLEYPSSSSIPVVDSDFLIKEVDTFLVSEDSIPPDAPVINNFDELNEDECFDPGEVRLMFLKILKMTIPLHLSFGLFSRFSPTLWILLYFSPPGVKTPFLTPASPLRAGGISSGWNFHVL